MLKCEKINIGIYSVRIITRKPSNERRKNYTRALFANYRNKGRVSTRVFRISRVKVHKSS